MLEDYERGIYFPNVNKFKTMRTVYKSGSIVGGIAFVMIVCLIIVLLILYVKANGFRVNSRKRSDTLGKTKSPSVQFELDVFQEETHQV